MKNKNKSLIAGAAAAFALLIGFQNCTQAVKNGSKESASLERNDNGTGYGGKVFVVRLSSGLCSDGSDIKARILTVPDGTAGLMNRDDCKEIAGVQIDLRSGGVYKSIQLNHSANPYDVLVVGGRIFDLLDDGARTVRFCQGAEPEGAGVRRSDGLIRSNSGQLTAYVESGVVDASGEVLPNTSHFSLQFDPSRTDNGRDEYYDGFIGTPQNGAQSISISFLRSGTPASGAIAFPSANLSASDMVCFEAE